MQLRKGEKKENGRGFCAEARIGPEAMRWSGDKGRRGIRGVDIGDKTRIGTAFAFTIADKFAKEHGISI